MIVRMSSTDALQDAGYHVLEARDGVEAVAVIELRDDVALASPSGGDLPGGHPTDHALRTVKCVASSPSLTAF
jgi:hypothetical protein